MSEKKPKNIIWQMLELISYKKTSRPKTFILPEMDEQQSKQRQESNKRQESEQQQIPENRQQSKGRNQADEQAKDTSQIPGGQEQKHTQAMVVERAGQRRRIPKKPLAASEVKSARVEKDQVKTDVNSNLQVLRQAFHVPENKDLIIRDIILPNKKRGFLAFLDGMVNKIIINEYILRPLLEQEATSQSGNTKGIALEDIVLTNDTQSLKNINEVISEILKGNTAVYVDGLDYILICETIGFEKRGVETPKTEIVVKGPQEAFSENLRTNITLLRRIIRNRDLVTEFFEIGEKSSTVCAIVYLQGLVNPLVVREVKRRLENIKIDFVVSAGMLEELIEDNPYSLFPTILNTERPDRTAASIMEGRVAIILDGTPIVLIVPVTLNALMHSSEDAALKWHNTTALRMVRFCAFAIAILLPGFYLALTTYHHEMIPTELLIAIAKAKENVPFPTIIEVLLMELGFELIREAGIRIPGIVGNTLGIIGALILGEAAVSANIVSPVLIIIVALTGLSNFALPNYSLAFGVRILRFCFIFAGAVLGFFGLALAAVLLTLMLVNLKSFGVPFMSIVAPRTKRGKDIVLRWPLWMQEKRPDFLNPLDSQRQPEIARQWTQQDPE
ncbi:MAG: spore germination protein [Peptococcaceae bacterium]|nr:spore germination protein [Peptococcaceae bacterium]